MKLYNTITRKPEEFHPINQDLVTVYACGPTVYDFVHIGNLRTFMMTDILVRTLKFSGYNVKYVMNITDVGHLVSDRDSGEDKLEKGAKREGKTAWDVAKFYTDAFLTDSKKMNFLEPDIRPRPTKHIPEQIAMVQKLLDTGYAYTIDDGIYFDTSQFPAYGALTGQNIEELQAGARVEVNPQKRNPYDFALWKFSPIGIKRDMEWESPWGVGFPGWHIECSAMSMKYLGEELDIHTGGADLIPIHHTNEIAQSEAATGKVPFVRYWVHGQFIMVDGEKMAKSKGNFYRIADLEQKGFDPLALRYLYLTAHYRSFLNFTWDGLTGAQNALNQLRSQVLAFKLQLTERTVLSEEKLAKADSYREKFKVALEDDLNMPQALSVVWETIGSNIPSQDKYDLLMNFDEILGFGLKTLSTVKINDIPLPLSNISLASVVPPNQLNSGTISMVDNRELARRNGDFEQADILRKQIEKNENKMLEDAPSGPRLVNPKP